MLTLIKRSFLLVVVTSIALVGCRKEKFDEYYGRPDDLAPPIYQQLEARGNFTIFLKLIDKASYKDILSKAGYWTLFAPNDAAIQVFFQENSIANAEAVSIELAEKIVRYALVFNAFKTDRISDFQSNIGWVPDQAYKRRTAYYDGFYKETVNGVERVVFASNRNNSLGNGTPFYVDGDNNNKYVPYFHEKYVSAKGLSATDYNYFYPNQPYTGFNFVGGAVQTADIIAENGIIHEVNKVSLPLQSIDQYLQGKPQYSLFKSILDKYLVTYQINELATRRYQILTGSSENVYIKVYNAGLAFSPNNENYLKQTDNDGQSDGYSMFVPTNTVLQEFINSKILEFYPSLDALPQYILIDIINSHMWQNTVWPSQFGSQLNLLEETARFSPSTNIVDKQILSNGIFYGTNKVQESNTFFSVYSRPYLNPNYTLMTRALNEEYRRVINNIGIKFTLFMMSDQLLRSKGFDYDGIRSEWVYTSPSTGVRVAGGLARARIQRILYNHIVSTPNNQLNDLSGEGYIRSGDRDVPGEYIKWNNNRVFAAGNQDANTVVNITGFDETSNGRVYYTDNLLEYSERGIGLKLAELAAPANSEFKRFFDYLNNSSLYNRTSGVITGVALGTSYTLLVPNNTSIADAITAGLLPASNNPTATVDREKVIAFIRYHILSRNTFAPDGNQDVTSTETLYKDGNDEVVNVRINNMLNNLSFTGQSNARTARVINASSINLADRTLIHLVDNYLDYR
ncbi:fasciclin domain-containing protein [Pedobacter alpinus]|uniref:Fasciclin domain-containing protein n=1 Tax=Pedobacter alpinus TaxID=1590643 RepID=A0ABW5TWN9_9SPHI